MISFHSVNETGSQLPHSHKSKNIKRETACWLLSHIWLFLTPGTAAHQASLSMEFSRQKYQSGLPFPSPGKKRNWFKWIFQVVRLMETKQVLLELGILALQSLYQGALVGVRRKIKGGFCPFHWTCWQQIYISTSLVYGDHCECN